MTLVSRAKRHSRKGLYEFLNREMRGVRGTVLSVGSGGEINDLLGRYPVELVQIDIDPARRPDIVGDICTARLGRYDCIVMSEVLEHVHSPWLAIENVRKALKPGGKLILSTPFMLPIHEAPVDYYRFTRYGLEHLLKGFSEVRIEERNSYGEAVGVLLLRLLHERSRWGLVIPPVVLMMWPLFRLVRCSGATTGYVATALR